MDNKGVEKPWGGFNVLFKEKGYQVKRIEVDPGSRLSLQTHKRRSEEWVVVQGHGLATVEEREIPVKRGSVVKCPNGVAHRMANTGDSPLVFIEVQLGDYLGEDDIVRLEDDYNRA
jgi:mannose-6-phosphate isomerase-like protein (cupin superfamily)